MLTALQHTAPRAASAAMPSAAAAVPGPLGPPLVRGQQRQLMPVQQQQPAQQWRQRRQRAAVVASAAAAPSKAGGAEGHTALLHSLGEVGEVAPVHMPWLLRLAHIKSRITGGDSNAALQESARGLLMWKVRAALGVVVGCGWHAALSLLHGYIAVANPTNGAHGCLHVCRRLRWSAAWCCTTSHDAPFGTFFLFMCLTVLNFCRRRRWSAGWCWTTSPSSS